MTQPAVKRATYADIEALPDDQRVELIDGQIVALPAPLPRHSNVQRVLGWSIGKPYHDDDGRGGPGGWWIFPEVDIAIGQEVVRPDVAGWRRGRLIDPGDMRPIKLAPDWVCEVLSPSTEAHDRVYKRNLYAGADVGYYWLINPAERVLEALALRGGQWIELGAYDDSATAVRIEPFDTTELDVSRLFLPR